MMQNNDFDDVIKMVNDNHERYIKSIMIKKEESRKFKRARIARIKAIKKVAISVSIGTLIIYSSSLIGNINLKPYITLAQNQTNIQKNINDSSQIIDKEIQFSNLYSENLKQEVETKEQVLIKKYCNEVFGLKYNVVYEIASKLTNNFTSEEYLNTNNPGYSINKKQANNIEHGIILFTRHLAQKPDDFGLSKNDVVDENFISPQKGNEEYKVKYYSDIYNIDPVLVLAIEYQESTSGGVHYASHVYSEYNNPAGLMDPSTSKIWKFKSPDAGIIEHIHQLKTKYLDKGYKTPEQIKQRYSPDGALNDPNGLNAHWVSGVKTFMREIQNNENIFDNKEQVESVKFSK